MKFGRKFSSIAVSCFIVLVLLVVSAAKPIRSPVSYSVTTGFYATIYYVDSSYKGPESGTIDQPYRTITKAIERAGSGDMVVVAPGLYRENIRLKQGVRLISPHVGAAIIHGRADRSGGYPTVTGANQAELRGFTITGGYTGILSQGSSPIIRRNLIRGNFGDGGIVCLDGCRAIIENNTILGNLGNAYNGQSTGIYVENGTPFIRNNIITGNDIGYAPYKSKPVEEYNNIWGNRRNFGYSARPGIGTTTWNPMFVNPSLDDYRLSWTSSCRNAGHPSPAYHDADGTRNDMGAFDGNGGYRVSLPVQEYFVESILGALDTESGPRINGTSRFNANPVFWFDATGRGTQGEVDARHLISSTLPQLTNHLYQATYRNTSQPPANRCSVVTVSFDGPRGIAFRQGVDSECHDPDFALERSGAPIIGGELHLASDWTAGIAPNSYPAQTLLHELGHVAGLWHSYRGYTMIGQGVAQLMTDYAPVEKEAFALLYSYPAGTSLDRLIRDGKITWNAMLPFPHIDEIWGQNGGRWSPVTSAHPGEDILLVGSRLSLRWSTEPRVSMRPADYTPPEVYFGNIRVVADLNNQTTYQGTPTRYLKVKVPSGASSGWVFVRSRGLESNSIYLELTP